MGWIINGTAELDQISEWQTILGVCIVLPILTATIVILRAYTRGHVLRGLGWDDYVIFFSAVRTGRSTEAIFSMLRMIPGISYHLCGPLHCSVKIWSWTSVEDASETRSRPVFCGMLPRSPAT